MLHYRCDKTITFSGDGLYETWSFGVVLEDLTDLANRAIDAVVRIKEDALAPDPIDDLVPGDELAPLLHQQEQKLHRDAFELEHTSRETQLIKRASRARN